MMHMRTILYPTDFSDSSKLAFPLAYSLARDHGARLIVLHVIRSGTFELANLAQLGQGESAQDFDDEVRRHLQRIQPPDDRVPMEYRLAKGSPAASIIKIAEEIACDLVVLGTHGRSGVSRILMGSVAEQVLRGSPCPVLVVKGLLPVTSDSSAAV